jgi:hypothetical protein
MDFGSIEVIDVDGVGESECERLNDESIHESICVEDKSIHNEWMSSVEALHRLGLNNKSALQQAISKLTSIHLVPLKYLRRGEARKTEYSQLAVDLIEAMKSDKTAFEQLKANVLHSQPVAAASIVFAPIRFKESADKQFAIANSQIIDLRQTAQLKLAQLKQLHGQWQEAEQAEEDAQEKDKEAQEARWYLECIEDVMREETYKKNCRREIKRSLEGGV